jgi:hypothetical protein
MQVVEVTHCTPLSSLPVGLGVEIAQEFPPFPVLRVVAPPAVTPTAVQTDSLKQETFDNEVISG